MRIGRLVALIVVLTCMMLIAGCEPKVYYFSFEDEGDFTNEEGTWGMMQPGPFSFGSYGVVLNGSLIYAPHKYNGDFTVTCNFAVDLGSEETMLVFILSPEPFIITSTYDDFVMISFPPITDDWTSLMAYEKGAGEDNLLFNGAVQGLLTHSTNKLRILKKGDNLAVELNDATKFSRNLARYDSHWSCLSIFAVTPAASVWIRDFQVEYSGSRAVI